MSAVRRARVRRLSVRVPEKSIQQAVKDALEAVGGKVWTLGTRRPRGDYQGTRQTPGLPDLLAFLPPRQPAEEGFPWWTLLVIEVKAEGGRLSDAQIVFRDYCLAARVAHIVGDLNAVLAWLEKRGYVRQHGVTIRET